MALRNCAYTCWRKVADEGAALGAGMALAMGTNWLLVDAPMAPKLKNHCKNPRRSFTHGRTAHRHRRLDPWHR